MTTRMLGGIITLSSPSFGSNGENHLDKNWKFQTDSQNRRTTHQCGLKIWTCLWFYLLANFSTRLTRMRQPVGYCTPQLYLASIWTGFLILLAMSWFLIIMINFVSIWLGVYQFYVGLVICQCNLNTLSKILRVRISTKGLGWSVWHCTCNTGDIIGYC